MQVFLDYPVVIAGDSHTGQIVGWETEPSLQLTPCKGIDGLFTVRDAWPRSPSYYRTVIDVVLGHDRLIPAVFLRGNDHLGSFLLEPDEPIDFFSSRFPELSVDPAARIVPEQLILDYFYSLYQPFLELFSELTRLGRRFISVATPPPKGSDEFLRAMLAKEGYFMDVLRYRGLSVESVRLTAPQTRLKLWGAVCMANARMTREAGGEFLDVPRSGVDGEGFLRENFYGTDCTHADFDYGDLIISHIAAYLEGKDT